MRKIESRDDIRKAGQVLAECYADAPNITWFLKPIPWKLRYFFTMITEEASNRNGAYLSKDEKGVLLLYRMGKAPFRLSLLWKKLVVALFIVGPANSIRLLREQAYKSSKKPESGLYGMALAIAPGKDIWRTQLEIRQEMIQLQEKTGLPIYCETTHPRIAALYEKLGFVTFLKESHPFTELEIWFMKREIPL